MISVKDANIFELRSGDGGRDGVRGDGTVAGGDDERVEIRGLSLRLRLKLRGRPSSSKNGLGLNLSFL